MAADIVHRAAVACPRAVDRSCTTSEGAECLLEGEGKVALVLTSARAADYYLSTPIRTLATGLQTAPCQWRPPWLMSSSSAAGRPGWQRGWRLAEHATLASSSTLSSIATTCPSTCTRFPPGTTRAPLNIEPRPGRNLLPTMRPFASSTSLCRAPSNSRMVDSKSKMPQVRNGLAEQWSLRQACRTSSQIFQDMKNAG